MMCLTNERQAVDGDRTQFTINWNAQIVDIISNILAESGLDGHCLNLEITENILIDGSENVLEKLRQIKSLGTSISIDDFGTGYSSLNYLKKIPIDYIKIDRSFIKGLPNNKHDVAIAEALIVMSRKLDMKIIAEGVETADQLQFLIDNDCSHCQGYYFSKPVLIDEINTTLTDYSLTKTGS